MSGHPVMGAPPTLRGTWRAGDLEGSYLEGALGSPPPALDAVYDLASLTKALVTGALYAELWLASGMGREEFFAQPVGRWLPDPLPGLADAAEALAYGALRALPLGALLEHRSGLPPHILCFDPPRGSASGAARETIWARGLGAIVRAVAPAVAAGDLRAPTAKTPVVYSDLGFLLLGAAYERRRGMRLDEAWAQWKTARGLPAEALTYGVPSTATARWARTEPAELRHPRGEVNDDNAAGLGGVAPHAGLFGSVDEVWLWLRGVAAWARTEPRVREWLTPRTAYDPGTGAGRFHWGWDRPSPDPLSQGGYPAPATAIGHLGFTGTALWWDPASMRGAVLLTNRVFPAHGPESQESGKKLRRQFFSAFWQGKLNAWEPVGSTS